MALTLTQYKTLTPASELRSLGIGNLSFNAAQPVSFAGTMSFIANIFFITALVTAVGFAIYAQSKVIVGGEKNLKEAKGINGHVIWGLILMFSMFVLIATFNKDLLLADFNLTAIKATRGVVTIPNTATTPATGGGATRPASVSGDEATVRAQLAGYSFNKGPCAQGQTSECTNVAGINPSTISMLQNLRASCSTCGTLTITGGTEPGHSTNSNHGVGKEAVDLAFNSSLKEFLRTKGTAAGDMSKCNTKYKWGGFIFWDEPPGCDEKTLVEHFHASFTGR